MGTAETCGGQQRDLCSISCDKGASGLPRVTSMHAEKQGCLLCSDGQLVLLGWGEEVTSFWDSQCLTLYEVFFTAGCVGNSCYWSLLGKGGTERAWYYHYSFSFGWKKTPCKLTLNAAKCHFKCYEKSVMFPYLKAAVNFPASLIQEKQMAESDISEVQWQEWMLSQKLHIPHLSNAFPSIRRSRPCQLAVRHSWGWSESEFILGVSRFCFAKLAGLLNSGIFHSPLLSTSIEIPTNVIRATYLN